MKRAVLTSCIVAALISAIMVINVFPGTVKYTYDQAGRLIQADYGGGKVIKYTYDAMGNKLSEKITKEPARVEVKKPPIASRAVVDGGK